MWRWWLRCQEKARGSRRRPPPAPLEIAQRCRAVGAIEAAVVDKTPWPRPRVGAFRHCALPRTMAARVPGLRRRLKRQKARRAPTTLSFWEEGWAKPRRQADLVGVADASAGWAALAVVRAVRAVGLEIRLAAQVDPAAAQAGGVQAVEVGLAEVGVASEAGGVAGHEAGRAIALR